MLDRLNDGIAVISADGRLEYVNDPAGASNARAQTSMATVLL
jgi:hypothetical protein